MTTRNIKPLLIGCILSFPLFINAQSPSLEKIWETDTVVAIPESVLPDASQKWLFVSLIDGGGWDADGKGGVARLSPDGQSYEPDWITGLNAPKGLGRYGNRLYTADISEVVVIDIKHRKVEKKIPIEGAKGLNDITVDTKGIVYVSDSRTGKVYRIDKDVPQLYLENMSGANGLKASGDSLYILAKKAVLVRNAAGNIRTIATLPHGGDGIEEVGNGDLIVSEWNGYVYYVYADGRTVLLLDRTAEKKNTADIHYDPPTHILYVPGFNGKTITAYKLILAASGTSKTAPSSTASLPLPRVFLLDANHLADLKQKIRQKDTDALQALELLKEQSAQLLAMRPPSVMDKGRTPPSGNKHDYMSQAPYFWYDSSKPNGLPYMRKDGERNPEINLITDHGNIGAFSSACRTLAVTWYLSGEEKYAAKAAQLLRTWFLDDSTKMNPNLEYAQAVPGVNEGRGTGIIESIPLTSVTDAAGLLAGSSVWSQSDEKALQQWFTQYLNWLLTSPKGNDEHHAKNNHGVWFLAQAADFALYTGNTEKAKELASEGKVRIEKQIDPNGRMPLETARTNGLGYSTFILRAFFDLATCAAQTGVDLWHYQNTAGAGIRTALDWLRPYAMGEQPWGYQQITPYNKGDYYSLLLKAGVIYHDPQYAEYASHLSHKKTTQAYMTTW